MSRHKQKGFCKMEAILNFDLSVLNWIQENMRCGFLDSFMLILSYVTTSGIIWIAAGVIMLFFRKTRAAGIILLAALAAVFLTGDVLLKHIVNRPRPFTQNPDIILLLKAPSGASFPSTHSGLAAAATTVLLAKKRALGFVALVLTICIAFSRMYLYFHYPTDVLCGLLLGVLCGLLTLWIAKKINLENKLSNRKKA